VRKEAVTIIHTLPKSRLQASYHVSYTRNNKQKWRHPKGLVRAHRREFLFVVQIKCGIEL